MSYEDKVLRSISIATQISDLEYIEDRLIKTPHINRRTKDGRKLTAKLVKLINARVREFIEAGEPPF